jgi:hypothetical protein
MRFGLVLVGSVRCMLAPSQYLNSIISSNALMDDKIEMLWRLAKDNFEHGRQHEAQRSTVCGLCLVLAGAAVTAIGFDKELNSADFPFAVFVVGIGLFGALMSEKYYELFRLHGKTAEYLLKGISDLMPAPEIMAIKPAADAEHSRKFPRIARLRLHHLWVGLHLFVALIGLCLVWKTFP